MPNNFFQFKQFTVWQDKSSMKVCTDSCLFAAWLAAKVEKKTLLPQHILDIGSGSGVLSLLLAQKSTAVIDAVEIEQNSYEQTKENFSNSKWRDRLRAFHTDVKQWSPAKKYDLIVCNPPFFENDLRSSNANKNLAKHDEGLTFDELLAFVSKNLNKNGNFAVLLPFQRSETFKRKALQQNFYLADQMLVKQTPSHSFFRTLLLFSTTVENGNLQQLAIKNQEGNYTEAFKNLLQDYYLYL